MKTLLLGGILLLPASLMAAALISVLAGQPGDAFVVFRLAGMTRSDAAILCAVSYALIFLIWLATHLCRPVRQWRDSVLHVVAVNVYLTIAVLAAAEGIASLALIGLDARAALTAIQRDQTPFTDPYTEKPTGRLKLASPFFIERYRPNSIAMFYYDQLPGNSPKALYTDRYGFIHNGFPERDIGVPVINGKRWFIFGGSSVAGANSTTSNKATIAAWTEQLLRAAAGDRTEIVNAGIEGFESFREYIYASHLFGQFQIDGLIFLNGRNDWYRGTAAVSHIWNYWPEKPKRAKPAFPGEGSHFKSLRIYRLFIRLGDMMANSKQAQFRTQPTALILKDGTRLPSDAMTVEHDVLFRGNRQALTYREEVLKNYITNLRSIAGLCLGWKLPCKIALQPTLGYGDHKLTNHEQAYLDLIPFAGWRQSQQAFFDAARHEFRLLQLEFAGSTVEFVDLTGAFDTEKGSVFLDSIHYLDRGNCILGSKLAGEIAMPDVRLNIEARSCEG